MTTQPPVVDPQKPTSRPDASAINLGCGRDTRGDDWHDVDHRDLPGVDEVVDLNRDRWPWPTDHFAHARASHIIEHLSDQYRALAELARIVKPGGSIRIVAPHPKSVGQETDPTHQHSLRPLTLEHGLVGDWWTVKDVTASRIRLGRLLPESAAWWVGDMIGHCIDEWRADLTVEVSQPNA